MRPLIRLIALLMLIVFATNVQAWALDVETDGAHHDSSSVVIDHIDASQHDSGKHDCNQKGHHCCHAINHLLGQISDDLRLSPPDIRIGILAHGPEDSSSITPQGIYHPPRATDLA